MVASADGTRRWFGTADTPSLHRPRRSPLSRACAEGRGCRNGRGWRDRCQERLDWKPARSLVRLGRTQSDAPLAWSADGKQLAYATSKAVWTVGVDNAAPRLVPAPEGCAGVGMVSNGTGGSPLLQPAQDGERSELWVGRRDGDRGRRLAVGFFFGNPSWSADGKRVVFALSQSAPAPNGIVYSANVATGGRRRLGHGITPSYSPASGEVAYILFSRFNPSATLVVSTVDGPKRRTPVEWNGATAPVWSPDGREVVGVKEFALEAVRVDGHGKRKIADTWADVTDLGWKGRT